MTRRNISTSLLCSAGVIVSAVLGGVGSASPTLGGVLAVMALAVWVSVLLVGVRASVSFASLLTLCACFYIGSLHLDKYEPYALSGAIVAIILITRDLRRPTVDWAPLILCTSVALSGVLDAVHLGPALGAGPNIAWLATFATGLWFGGQSTSCLASQFIRGLTWFAGLVGAVAVYEWRVGHPLVAYSADQLPRYAGVPFRASGSLPHPLVLATFVCVVIAIILLTPRRFSLSAAAAAAVPLAGALVTGSRSVAYLLAVAIVAGLVARAGYSGARRRLILSLGWLGVGGGVVALAGLLNVLLARFDVLRSDPQTVRTQALDLGLHMLSGYQWVVGGGAGYVGHVFSVNPALLAANSGFTTLDNGLVGFFVSFGVLGCLALFACFWKIAVSIRRKDASVQQRTCAVGALVLIAACASFEVFAWAPFIFLFGWFMGQVSRVDEPMEGVADVSRGLRPGLATWTGSVPT